MCEKGDIVTMVLPARPLSDPFGKHLTFSIDRCIAPIVAALNRGGIATTACCCGHGDGPGSIFLGDGRSIVIAANQAEHAQLTLRVEAPEAEHADKQPNGRETGQ